MFKPSVFFLVWCLNNLDLVLQSDSEDARNFTTEYFNVTEKMKFILSLNELLSNIELSEINMTVDTATTILQVGKQGCRVYLVIYTISGP